MTSPTRFFLALPAIAIVLATACGGNEQNIYIPPSVEPPLPPDESTDDEGSPPNFTSCNQGWFASYYNLPNTHPDVEPEEASLPGLDPAAFDWWDNQYIAYEKYDPSLEFGPNWWPVEEGLQDDPAYFSVKWNAWLRATDDSDVQMVLAGSSDAWVMLGESKEVIASIEGVDEFTVLDVTHRIDSGVYPIQIRYSHRMGSAGFRFRVVQGDVIICFPDFSED